MIVINENDREINVGSTGFHLFVDGRKKYFGRFRDALKRYGWEEAAKILAEEAQPFLHETAQELFPKKVRVKWPFEGIAGPYEAETYPHHRGVILNLTAFTDSHLAKSPTTSSTVFPGTHAQAGVSMVVMDVQSRAFKDGPFTSENELIEFIRARLDLVKAAMAKFTEIDGKGGSSDDEDEGDGEDSEDQEAA